MAKINYSGKKDFKVFTTRKGIIKRLKEKTCSFIHGHNPPHFSIDEDNIDDYFEEINKIAGKELI